MRSPPALHPVPLILGYSEAAMFLRSQQAADVTAVISIHGAYEHGVDVDVPQRIDLRFDDVDVPDANDPIATWRLESRRRWAADNGRPEVAPTAEDVTAVIRFAESLRGTRGVMLCHCGAGISRAPAAALICLSVWNGAGSERRCMEAIDHLRPGATPHVGVVRLADDLLGRDGRLNQALREFIRDRRS